MFDIDERDASDCLRDVIDDSTNEAVTRNEAAYKLSERGIVSSQVEWDAAVTHLIERGVLQEVGGNKITVMDGCER